MLSVLIFIVLIVILSSTIFCLKNVELNFYSNTINLTNKQQIIESGNFKYNQSIFFVNKQKYITTLERNNPYLKVVNIETLFPNKLVINATERNELFVVKTYENNTFKNYAFLDDELKLLSTSSTYTNSNLNPIYLTIENLNISSKTAGETLEVPKSEEKYLLKLANELLAYENNVLFLKANFQEINFNFESKNNLRIKMRSGVEILLKEYNNRFEEKFVLALSYYNSCNEAQKQSGRITVFENNDGIIQGYSYL